MESFQSVLKVETDLIIWIQNKYAINSIINLKLNLINPTFNSQFFQI